MPSLSRALLIGLVLTAASSLNAVDAQTPARTGSTVRLTLAGGQVPLTGRLSSVDAEALTVTQPDGVSTRVAPGEILQAEVLMRRRNTLRGTFIGGGVGLVGGLLIVSTDDDPCSRDQTGLCDALTGWTDSFVLVLAPVAGAALGALVGTMIVSERWVPALLPGRVEGSVALRWTLGGTSRAGWATGTGGQAHGRRHAP